MGSREYALGRTEAERQRLTLQDRVIARYTEEFLRDAGLEAGMRVVDLGSGAGDVSLLVARIVGPSGSVLGVDIDPASVDTATRRVAESGVTNIEFETTDLAYVELEQASFDAVVGRMILMHLPDPVAVLQRIVPALRPGSRIAFQEAHLWSPWLSFPVSPTLEQVQRVRARALAGGQPVNPHMGLALRDTFMRAGLDDPNIGAEVVVVRGDDRDGCRLVEQTVRSLLPGWRQHAIDESDAIEPDGLATRLHEEVGEQGAIMIYPLVRAWTGLPR